MRVLFNWGRNRRRGRLRAQPFPPEWLRIVEKNVPMYRRLSEEDRRALLGHVHVFLAEKRFEGCGGLELTDEIRVTIAAQACVLLLRLQDNDYYSRLRSILVYPRGYIAHQATQDGHVVHEGPSARLGESWADGAVVLSWQDARAGAANAGDGANVVLHEFAHQLDQEDGAADGTPELESFAAYLPWARVLSEEYLALRRAARKGGGTVLDRYGTQNEAEFFAVATEAFFEKPALLQRRHPELYEELKDYYNQDPAANP
ncbi:MAG TPA: M90 family metallopeptidase [Longimicrobiaceae bacterium]|nr:M90 family metallopeptidase [Longimicrobiaceae bacterium]